VSTKTRRGEGPFGSRSAKPEPDATKGKGDQGGHTSLNRKAWGGARGSSRGHKLKKRWVNEGMRGGGDDRDGGSRLKPTSNAGTEKRQWAVAAISLTSSREKFISGSPSEGY